MREHIYIYIYSCNIPFEQVLATEDIEEVKAITEDCQRRVKAEPIPSCVSSQLRESLYNVFPDLSSRRFAVRSSCADEDSAEMSAAGQMETFLGVKGEKEVQNRRTMLIIYIQLFAIEKEKEEEGHKLRKTRKKKRNKRG